MTKAEQLLFKIRAELGREISFYTFWGMMLNENMSEHQARMWITTAEKRGLITISSYGIIINDYMWDSGL